MFMHYSHNTNVVFIPSCMMICPSVKSLNLTSCVSNLTQWTQLSLQMIVVFWGMILDVRGLRFLFVTAVTSKTFVFI